MSGAAGGHRRREARGDGSPGPAARAGAGTLLPALVGVVALALTAADAAGQAGPAGDEEAAGYQAASGAELGWGGSFDLGITVTQGNSETSNFSLSGRTVNRGERHRWLFAGSYLRASTDGQETANKGELAVQYDYFPGERFFFFGRAAGSFNEPAGLDLRLAPGLGAGYLLAGPPGAELALEGGATWIRDEFVDGSSTRSVFLALGQTLHWKVSETTTVDQSLTYNPRSTRLDDYLLTGEASVSTRIAGGLGLKLTLRNEFDSTPFVDPGTGVAREKNDLTLVTGVTYEF